MSELEDDLIEEAPLQVPLPSRPPNEPIEMTVKVKAEGMRLDHYVHMYFQDFSRTDLQEGIKTGRILVNGKASKASYKVRNNDQLTIRLPEPTHDLPVPEDIPLEVLFEDENVALINKPWNMVVHPAKGNWTGTLVNALQYHFRDNLARSNGTLRPGIVHRLDKDTSGVILVAKDDLTLRDLSMQFETRKVFKEYVALTSGEMDRDSDYIEAPLKLNPLDRVKMIVPKDPHDPQAKEAVSYYELMERFRGFNLVKIQPKTGRTHQIRVHLAHIGCPVLADKLYGGRDAFRLSELLPTTLKSEDETLLARQALHAFRLRFKHPRKGTWLEVEAPLPPDMRRTLELLRQLRSLRK